MYAATSPSWLANNLLEIAVVTLLVLTLLVARLVQKSALRITLLGILAALALFVYANRAPLEACARTCECSVVGRDITVPGCNADGAL
jgi:predicted membrane metal-binding protein